MRIPPTARYRIEPVYGSPTTLLVSFEWYEIEPTPATISPLPPSRFDPPPASLPPKRLVGRSAYVARVDAYVALRNGRGSSLHEAAAQLARAAIEGAPIVPA